MVKNSSKEGIYHRIKIQFFFSKHFHRNMIKPLQWKPLKHWFRPTLGRFELFLAHFNSSSFLSKKATFFLPRLPTNSLHVKTQKNDTLARNKQKQINHAIKKTIYYETFPLSLIHWNTDSGHLRIWVILSSVLGHFP